MKQIRLLPLVIVASLALLLFKGVGLVTDGAYVLKGTTGVLAAGDGGHAAPAEDAGQAAPTMAGVPTLADASPTMEDTAVTLPMGGETAQVPALAAEAGHGASAAAQPETETVEAHQPGVCPPEGRVYGGGEAVPEAPEGCLPIPVNAMGDAIPLFADKAGNMIALDGSDASGAVLLQRLNERRDELDARSAELDMRLALVEAAEKRLAERAGTLEALEAQINALVDQKRAMDDEQFAAVVSMYETMKPKDAAAILDRLEMPVLIRVARAINPRKMAPIMARMDTIKAKELTAALAVDKVEPTLASVNDGLAGLPAIIGQ